MGISKLMLLIFISIFINACFKPFEPPIGPEKIKYLKIQNYRMERFLVNPSPLNSYKELENDVFSPPDMISFYDSIFNLERIDNMYFRKDSIVELTYFTKNAFVKKELNYLNAKYDYRVYEDDPFNPLFSAFFGFDDTTKITMYVAFTLDKSKKPNNFKAVYQHTYPPKSEVIDELVNYLNPPTYDTMYLNTISVCYKTY